LIRVLATRRLIAEDVAYLRDRLDPRVELVVPPEFSDEALEREARSGIDVLFGPYASEGLLAACGPRLRFVQVPWTGVDSLDFEVLRRLGTTVCNSHSNAPFVAEHAVALLLSAARAIPSHDRDLRRGHWRRPGAGGTFVPPTTLRGSVVLLLGYGAIATHAAHLLAGFGAELVGVRRRSGGEPQAPLHALVGRDGMGAHVTRAHFVLVALPLSKETRGFVDAAFFERMRNDAFLINVSRGEIVVEEALYDALKNERIAGAAIDTWYNYPKAGQPVAYPSTRFPFHELENLVLSPHRSGFARGLHPHLEDAVENLNRAADGKAPLHIVDLDAGY
jgi:phosphoglycerate dehydrogenase-like enzyme